MVKLTNPVRLGFVGPMLGSNPGWVVSQGEILSELFCLEGYSTRLTSTIPDRAMRLIDTTRSLLQWRNEIDLVILMVFSGPAFGIADFASLLTKWIGKPLVLWLHGGSLPDFSEKHPKWVQRVLERGDILVSPSNFLAHYFRELGFKVEVIPNVLKIENYPFRHRKQAQPHLLWMRTFEDIYRPKMAVQVLKELKKDYPEAYLTMAGQDRGQLEPLKHFVYDNGLAQNVSFTGFLDETGKRREFCAHDIFLNTNQIDNMPVSVVEAAAFGLPIVATAVGGIPFLLEDEVTGILVGDGDVAGMAAAVARLISEPALVACLSANGRRLAESCAWPAVKGRWEELFHKLQLPSSKDAERDEPS